MRGTPACRYVIGRLESVHGHLSAEELFTSLPPALAGCDRSTIHRQLTRLLHAGVLHAVPSARGLTYGLQHDTEHDHESCQHCGRTVDTPPRRTQSIHHSNGFLSAVATNVTMGSCAVCVKLPTLGGNPT